ncbi:MAG TPA: DUF4198 domain-containing protein [Burkholderiaceae bacterium]|nr:DUF4198 domain-containing protein [Burkholderiaceae bacterium]
MRLKTLACLLAACAPSAWAHDTWFAPRASANPAEVALTLGTGNQFPLYETGVAFEYLARSGCRSDGQAKPIALQRVDDAPAALWLRANARSDRPLSCWAQLTPFEVELPPDKIAIYFKDIQASPTVREQWARMNARGVPWKERYTKHARIELKPDASAAAPVDMAMDVLIESPQRPLRPGQPMQFRVLRDGAPLPDFAVELRSERSPFGLWRKTDAQGRVDFAVPLPGRWVLRGTDLRLSDSEPDLWVSRFVTLAFDVAPASANEARR